MSGKTIFESRPQDSSEPSSFEGKPRSQRRVLIPVPRIPQNLRFFKGKPLPRRPVLNPAPTIPQNRRFLKEKTLPEKSFGSRSQRRPTSLIFRGRNTPNTWHLRRPHFQYGHNKMSMPRSIFEDFENLCLPSYASHSNSTILRTDKKWQKHGRKHGRKHWIWTQIKKLRHGEKPQWSEIFIPTRPTANGRKENKDDVSRRSDRGSPACLRRVRPELHAPSAARVGQLSFAKWENRPLRKKTLCTSQFPPQFPFLEDFSSGYNYVPICSSALRPAIEAGASQLINIELGSISSPLSYTPLH